MTLSRTLRRLFLLLTSAIVVGYLLGALKIIEKAERLLSMAFSFTFTEPHDDRVVVVSITEENYETIFGRHSPLRPEPLLQIVKAIAAYGPAVIGVDVSSAAFSEIHEVPVDPPVIWARDAFVDQNSRLRVEPLHVRTAADRSGIAVLFVDNDGVLRKYQRWMTTTAPEPEPSFPARVAWTYRQEVGENGAQSTDSLFIDYAHFRQRGTAGCPAVTASRVLRGAPPAFRPRCFTAQQVLDSTKFAVDERNTWRAEFAGKAVLIGGTYAFGGDTSHSTPVGGLAGVEIMAQAVATEIEGRGRKPIDTYGALVFFVLLAYLALPFDPPLSTPWRWLRMLAIATGAALAASFVVHRSIHLTPRYLLVFACVLILQLLTSFLKSVTGEAVLAAALLRRHVWARILGWRSRPHAR